ncbi:MAG TPA: hypothetical protein PKE03_10420 [Bacteroidales bacterium]|nr:hypothetical protein [Bacteroidales bacterium]
MIEEKIKIHNDFSFEIKLGYIARKKIPVSEFAVNIWFFIPNSLDINHNTYDKKDFYRDLKSNIRLITPVYLMRDIGEGERSPLLKLQQAMQRMASEPTRTNIEAYEHHIKMFLSILKSSIRDECAHIIRNSDVEDVQHLTGQLIENIQKIIGQYRRLRNIINAPTIQPTLVNYYNFGDEFVSNIVEYHCFRLIKSSRIVRQSGKIRKPLLNLIEAEIDYRKQKGFPVPKKNSPDKNQEFVHRLTLLKKYAENVLFLTAHKKRDGVLKEQFYYSLAAGLSMIFATAIAFSFQAKYGNLTMPFFVALVVSYMLKDRIKELSRFYFAHKLGRSYFDLKTKISLNNQVIGWSKEAMDFVYEDKLPERVRKLRNRSAILEADNRNNNEKIILYRKLVRLDRQNLNEVSDYTLLGINDIIRFNVSSFLLKMDNPEVPLFVPDEDKFYAIVPGEKIYYLNLIMQMKYEDQTKYKRFRIILNRKGIKHIERFEDE